MSEFSLRPNPFNGCHFEKSDFSRTTKPVFCVVTYTVATRHSDGRITTETKTLRPSGSYLRNFGDGDVYGVNDPDAPWNYPSY